VSECHCVSQGDERSRSEGQAGERKRGRQAKVGVQQKSSSKSNAIRCEVDYQKSSRDGYLLLPTASWRRKQ